MIFYTKPGCHLCADALPHVRKVARLFRRRLEVIDIDTDDDLVSEFGLRIPVLTTDGGTVLAEGSFGAVQVIKALLAPGSAG